MWHLEITGKKCCKHCLFVELCDNMLLWMTWSVWAIKASCWKDRRSTKQSLTGFFSTPFILFLLPLFYFYFLFMHSSIHPSIDLLMHPSAPALFFLFLCCFAFHYIYISPPSPPPPPLHTLLSYAHLSMSLFFSSCSSRQPSWRPATEVTSHRAWLFPPHRYTRWGRLTSTVSPPPPWPRCRVSFIKPWVSTLFHFLFAVCVGELLVCVFLINNNNAA